MEFDEEALTAAHLHLENLLVDLRDSRISTPLYGNGLVIREYDGEPSSIIRIGTREALRIGIETYLENCKEVENVH